MKMWLAFSLLALSAQAGPILMSGSGSWEWSRDENTSFSVVATGAGATVSFSGSGAGDWQDLTQLFGGTVNCGFGCNGMGFAAIGTTQSSYFEFELDGANSYLNLYADQSGTQEIASAELVAYLQVTSEQINYNNGIMMWSQGTFAVVPTPEPGTGWMALTAAGAFLFHRRSSHKAALTAARRT